MRSFSDPRLWSAKGKLFLTTGVVVMAAAWRLIAWSLLHSSRVLANDLAAVDAFVGPVFPSPSCDQLLLAQNTQAGVEVATFTMKSGRKHHVWEIPESKMLSGTVRLLGWSPDGSVFAHTRPVRSNKQEIVVYSGYVGGLVDDLRLDSILTSFAWLTARSFAFADKRQDITVMARDQRGKWSRIIKVASSGDGVIQDLSALSSGLIAWRQGNAVYMVNLSTGKRELVWRNDQAARVDLACTMGSETLLIGAEKLDGSYSVLGLYLGPPQVTNFFHQIGPRRVIGVRSINQGKGYALLCTDRVGRSLLVSHEGEQTATLLFEHGSVQHVTPQGRRLFIVGSTNMEPLGVWEYDCLTGSMRPALSGTENGAKICPDFRHETKNLSIGHREVIYHLWSPQPTIFRRKFPLVIGQTPYGWTPYPHMAVNAGFCFVTIDRPAWDNGIETWSEDVMRVYEQLRTHPRVDITEAYLYGRSAETLYLSGLAVETPNLWKGAILFSPGQMPDPNRCNFKKMFVDLGEYDKGARERLTAYQTQAAMRGVSVRLVVHGTARHTSWSQATQRTRLKNLAEFLND